MKISTKEYLIKFKLPSGSILESPVFAFTGAKARQQVLLFAPEGTVIIKTTLKK